MEQLLEPGTHVVSPAIRVLKRHMHHKYSTAMLCLGAFCTSHVHSNFSPLLLNSTLPWPTGSSRLTILLATFKNYILGGIAQPSQILWAHLIN